MKKAFRVARNLARAALLSSFVAAPAVAHEVQPAVADVEIFPKEISLTIELTLEPLLAGMNLAGLSDTNDSPLAGLHDVYRSKEGEEIAAEFRQRWPDFEEKFIVQVMMMEPVALDLYIRDIQVPTVGNPELPRVSVLTLVAPVFPDDSPIRVGWAEELGPLVVRQAGEGDALYSSYLTKGALSDPLSRTGVVDVGGFGHFIRYVVIGFEHILPKGLDHILFVLGLFFFSLKLRPLVIQVTTFTLAHTVTLALATLGLVTVSPAIVEPLIAASITYVAIENIFRPKLGWWRTAVVFGFGLLHGLGFASVLGDIGLEPSRFIASLIAFNIGVEIGQLTVIAAAFLAVGLWFGNRSWYRAAIAIPASCVIAVIGGWWVIERTLP